MMTIPEFKQKLLIEIAKKIAEKRSGDLLDATYVRVLMDTYYRAALKVAEQNGLVV